jgi:hypothetical protein
MKITGYANAQWDAKRKLILLAPAKSDYAIIEKLFARKASREDKDGAKVYPEYTLEIAARDRTFKQNRAIWALITVIFRSMHGRKPTEEEKHDLYLDVLDMYAEKVPNRFTGALRPVHLSESDVYQAGKIVTHLIDVLIEYCDLSGTMDESGKDISADLQADVRTIFNRWQEWRGGLARDPLDYDEEGNELDLVAWMEKHRVSDATGLNPGNLQLCHIVSRGADEADIDRPWNWLRLEEPLHIGVQHQNGWERLLQAYPHLRSRVLRARSLAGAL